MKRVEEMQREIVMFKKTLMAVAGLSLTAGAVSVAASQAYAGSPEHYCAYYATSAVHMAEVARSVSSCRHLVDEAPQRWSLNYGQHFAYCMRIYGSGNGMAEDATRIREVKFCAGP